MSVWHWLVSINKKEFIMSSRGKNKDVGVAYVLWLATFLGFAGLHRLYCGRIFSGVLWFFTWGLFGLGTLFDFFWTAVMVADCNGELDDEIPEVRQTETKEVHHHHYHDTK